MEGRRKRGRVERGQAVFGDIQVGKESQRGEGGAVPGPKKVAGEVESLQGAQISEHIRRQC